MAFTGSGTLVALGSIDLGNNSGVMITQLSSRNLYWVAGTGNGRITNHWSLTDGVALGNLHLHLMIIFISASNSFTTENR